MSQNHVEDYYSTHLVAAEEGHSSVEAVAVVIDVAGNDVVEVEEVPWGLDESELLGDHSRRTCCARRVAQLYH